MQKFCLVICTLFIVAIANCQKKTSSTRVNDVNNFVIKNGNEKLIVKGEVNLSEDDKSIQNLSENGSVVYNKNKHSLIITKEKGTLKYKINGKPQSVAEVGENRLFQDCVQYMIRNGVDAERRMGRIYSQAGSAEVLKEVAFFESDFVKEKYLSALLKKKLTQEEMVSLLQQADIQLSSDYYKSELLKTVSNAYSKSNISSAVFLKVVKGIDSDYYQQEALRNMIRSELNDEQFSQILAIIREMRSDYYQAELLKKMLADNNLSPYRKEMVLKIAQTIKSDYYTTEIILASLKNMPHTERYTSTFMTLINVKSDYYKTQILSKLIDPAHMVEANWSNMIDFTKTLKSDYYQATILQKIGMSMPDSNELRKKLKDSAKLIKSDYYAGQVFRTLD